MNKKNIKSNIFLLLAAVIWGGAFVAQSVGMDYMQPLTFNCARFLVGAVVLVPVVIVSDLLHKRKLSFFGTKDKRAIKDLVTCSLICGSLLALASSIQQIGISYTTAGKAGFITALYIVLVPIFGLLFKKRPSPLIWIAVALAFIGMYFLCVSGEFSLQKGDLYLMICAVIFAFHILTVDHYSDRVDGIRLSCGQFIVCTIICSVFVFTMEEPQLDQIVKGYIPLLYAGVLSCGVAYTFQIIGQKDNNPTVASLIMSLESVFSVIAGWLILNQKLSTRETVGCVIMFLAVILAQIPGKKLNLPAKLNAEATDVVSIQGELPVDDANSKNK